MGDENKLTPEQLDLIEHFLAAHEKIGNYLRSNLNLDITASYSHLVNEYKKKYPRWRDDEFLIMISELRNAIVHKREKAYGYLSVPLQWVVDRTEEIRDGLIKPELVIPQFQRKVTLFQAGDTLFAALQEIASNSFSQFPVYEKGLFRGLLTENGITRWLAFHTENILSLVEFKEITLAEVLSLEEKRTNYKFIPRSTSIRDAENLFLNEPALEALLITEKGRGNEDLLGIITTSDIVKL